MADIKLTFECEPYYCEPCSLKQGTPVTELVRMIPKPYVMFGKLVGDEFYCCPICFDPKFQVKGKTKVKDGARIKEKRAETAEKHSGTGSSPLRLVTDERTEPKDLD